MVRHSSDINLNKYNTKIKEKKADNNGKPKQRSKSIIFRDKNFLSEALDDITNISKINIAQGIEMEKNNNYKGLLSEIEIMKINEHIHKDINFIHLKKKISKLKRTIQRKNSKKDLLKIKT